MSGQSSFSCDRKEDSPSQETKQPNEFSAAPSRSPDLPRNERRRVRPLPRFFFTKSPILSFHSLLGRPCSISLFWSVVPWPASPSEARADVSSALSVRSVLLSFRLIFRRLRETGVGGGVGAEAAGRCSHLLLLLRGGASSSAAAALSASGRRPAASSSFEALGKEAGLLELVPL